MNIFKLSKKNSCQHLTMFLLIKQCVQCFYAPRLIASLICILVLTLSANSHASDFCDEGILTTLAISYPDLSYSKDAYLGQYTVQLNDSNSRVAIINKRMAQCHIFPGPQALAIIALRIEWPQHDKTLNENDVVDADLEIFVVEYRSKKIISHYVEKGVLLSDAVYVESIDIIDTALEPLSTSVPVFGVLVNRSGSSSVNPFNYNTLSLYALEGNNTRKILNEFLMYDFGGENNGRCAGSYRVKTSELHAAKTPTNKDFVPILISTRIKKYTTKMMDKECIDIVQKDKKTTTKLRYIDNGYR